MEIKIKKSERTFLYLTEGKLISPKELADPLSFYLF